MLSKYTPFQNIQVSEETMTFKRPQVKQGTICKAQMRCEHLNAVMSYIQLFTIDSILLCCIVSGYAATYFTHQTNTNKKV